MTNRIRDLRQERAWSLRTMAKQAGISIDVVWRVENGAIPKLTTAFQLARAFQLSVYEVWNITTPVTCTPLYVGRLPAWLRIPALREIRKWKPADLARGTGIPVGTISKIEQGRIPSLENALRIATALEASIYQLWNIPDARNRSGATMKDEATGGRLQMSTMAGIRPLPEVKKAAILSAVTQMNGEIPLAADALGVPTTTLYRKLREYGVFLKLDRKTGKKRLALK